MFIFQNEWVISRVFKKISAGKKTHISGLVNANESRPSPLPPLMESSSYDSETRTRVREMSPHVTCFSNPMEDQKTNKDMVDGLNSHLVAASSSSNPAYIPSALNMGNLYYSDSASMHEQSILRILLENQAPNMEQITKAEFSPETAFSTDISSVVSNHDMAQRSFEDQEPSSCAGPVDIDCIWNYEI
jgi:hypothetical protein